MREVVQIRGMTLDRSSRASRRLEMGFEQMAQSGGMVLGEY